MSKATVRDGGSDRSFRSNFRKRAGAKPAIELLEGAPLAHAPDLGLNRRSRQQLVDYD